MAWRRVKLKGKESVKESSGSVLDTKYITFNTQSNLVNTCTRHHLDFIDWKRNLELLSNLPKIFEQLSDWQLFQFPISWTPNPSHLPPYHAVSHFSVLKIKSPLSASPFFFSLHFEPLKTSVSCADSLPSPLSRPFCSLCSSPFSLGQSTLLLPFLPWPSVLLAKITASKASPGIPSSPLGNLRNHPVPPSHLTLNAESVPMSCGLCFQYLPLLQVWLVIVNRIYTIAQHFD